MKFHKCRPPFENYNVLNFISALNSDAFGHVQVWQNLIVYTQKIILNCFLTVYKRSGTRSEFNFRKSDYFFIEITVLFGSILAFTRGFTGVILQNFVIESLLGMSYLCTYQSLSKLPKLFCYLWVSYYICIFIVYYYTICSRHCSSFTCTVFL